MGELYSIAGFLMSGVAAMLMYVGAQHQKLLAKPLPGLLQYLGVSFAVVLALAFLNAAYGPAIAIFVMLTSIMLVWSVLPLILAFLSHRRKEIANDE